MLHECTQQEIITEIREFIRELKIRNEYSAKQEEKTDKLLEQLIKSHEEHDKRITALEVLPAQVKDIQESRTIKTDRWLTAKLNTVIFGGVMVIIIGTSITFMLFLKKLYDIVPK